MNRRVAFVLAAGIVLPAIGVAPQLQARLFGEEYAVRVAPVDPIDPFEFVRTIAVARITMPTSYVRLSAGRQEMDEALQALCLMAGANSIFYGDHLLTTPNPGTGRDRSLLERLDMRIEGQDAA